MPAPMIAPMPSSVTLTGPSVRFRANCGPPAVASMSSRFFVRKSPRSKVLPPPQKIPTCACLTGRGSRAVAASCAEFYTEHVARQQKSRRQKWKTGDGLGQKTGQGDFRPCPRPFVSIYFAALKKGVLQVHYSKRTNF